MKFYTVDAHCDTVHLFAQEHYNFWQENTCGQIDYPRLKQGGVNLQFFALFVEPEYKPFLALSRALQLMEHFFCTLEKNKANTIFIKTKKELQEAVQNPHKLAVIMALEGGEPLESSKEILHIFYRLGLRSVGLTWNQRNQLADGVGVGKGASGLTKMGKEIVKHLNRLGIVVDGAHLAKRGFYDLLETATKPVLVSHANAAALCPHPRNLDKEQLLALKAHKGVVGLTFYPDFIAEKEATLEKLLDHFCYIADLAGVEILGLGSDFDGIEKVLPELSNVSHLPALTAGLRRRGFSEKEIAAIMGENMLKLLSSNLLEEEENDSCRFTSSYTSK
ncbi:MAG: membrane dipeptidase [Firmicutes bacterium]|nr:membrane dipeptidase [Bacillota bacterium]